MYITDDSSATVSDESTIVNSIAGSVRQSVAMRGSYLHVVVPMLWVGR